MTSVGSRFDYRVTATAICGRKRLEFPLTMRGTFTPQAGGSFSTSRKARPNLPPFSGHVDARFRLLGHVRTDGGDGRLFSRVTLHDHKARTRCFVFGATGPWSVRPASHPSGPPLTTPLGASLFGATSQSSEGLSYTAVVFPWETDGQIRVEWSALAFCRGGTTSFFANVTPVLTPDAQGHFEVHEHFSLKFANGAVAPFRADTVGQLFADGAVGTFRLRQVFPNGTPFPDRCDNYLVSWTAAP
jgi:hypothetical protein